MPLPRRGGEPRLAGARVVRTTLPRATPRSPRRVGRGAPLLSHAQRLTRRRHSSEQAPPEPEQADFHSGKWLQERAGGDAKDPQHTPAAGMGSRQRSVSAAALGRAARSSRGVAGPVVACEPLAGLLLENPQSPPRRGALGTDRLPTVRLWPPPGRDWTGTWAGPETGPPLIGRCQ
ncbi:hypothetical protein LTLLF_128925 [Microtus ochrogaster]|uniref:Uncharacterized protein n=1 Tax=Microtus ochrogaster TaxID=79684 RepID=A0A8J6GRS7_MICOH|nr:hypothetical protein LTLLF_128925 [Microtus ochrogaster]